MEKIEEQRAFKGIWIAAGVWRSTSLSILEKIFLAEIDSLDNGNGCFASNAYFSKFFQLSERRCQQVIQSLKNKGYLSISIERQGVTVVKRTLKLTGKTSDTKDINDTVDTNDTKPSNSSKPSNSDNSPNSQITHFGQFDGQPSWTNEVFPSSVPSVPASDGGTAVPSEQEKEEQTEEEFLEAVMDELYGPVDQDQDQEQEKVQDQKQEKAQDKPVSQDKPVDASRPSSRMRESVETYEQKQMAAIPKEKSPAALEPDISDILNHRFFSDDKVDAAFRGFLVNRRTNGRPASWTEIEGLVARLEEMESDDMRIASCHQSTEKGYLNLFPVSFGEKHCRYGEKPDYREGSGNGPEGELVEVPSRMLVHAGYPIRKTATGWEANTLPIRGGVVTEQKTLPGILDTPEGDYSTSPSNPEVQAALGRLASKIGR